MFVQNCGKLSFSLGPVVGLQRAYSRIQQVHSRKRIKVTQYAASRTAGCATAVQQIEMMEIALLRFVSVAHWLAETVISRAWVQSPDRAE